MGFSKNRPIKLSTTSHFGQSSLWLRQVESLVIPWWNPDGQTPAGVAIGAWQAKGAASQAAAEINLVTPGTYDLVGVGGTPAWNTLTGFNFVSATPGIAYDTTLVTNGDQWSYMYQYTGAITDAALMGARLIGGLDDTIEFRANVPYGNGKVWWLENTTLNHFPPLLSGNLSLSGVNGYADGVLRVTFVGGEQYTGGLSIALGMSNYSDASRVVGQHSMVAAAIYNRVLTPGEVVARVAAMAAL